MMEDQNLFGDYTHINGNNHIACEPGGRKDDFILPKEYISDKHPWSVLRKNLKSCTCRVFLYGQYFAWGQIPSKYSYLWPKEIDKHFIPPNQYKAQLFIVRLLNEKRPRSGAGKLNVTGPFYKDRKVWGEFLKEKDNDLPTQNEIKNFNILIRLK